MLPVPGEKVGQARERHVWHACQSIGQPGLRVDVVHLGGDDEGIHQGGALAAAGRTGEEPRLAAKGDTDLLLNFHPAANGARLVFTPIGAG